MSDGIELYFMDEIKNPTAFDWVSGQNEEQSLLKSVIDQINSSPSKKVKLLIDSMGGQANVGLGIYNFLKNCGKNIETQILNQAGSIATVIASAGKKITMPKHGLYGIHEAYDSVTGTAEQLRNAADMTDKITDNVFGIYQDNNRKGKTKDELKALVKNGGGGGICMMTGEEALENGFVDELTNDVEDTIQNSIAYLTSINYTIPESLKEVKKDVNSIKNTIMTIGNFITDALKSIKNKTVNTQSKTFMPEFADSIAEPLNEMVTNIENSVNTEMTNIKNEVKTSIDAFKIELEKTSTERIQSLQTTIETLTNDLAEIKGKPAAEKVTRETGNKPIGSF